MFRFADHNFPQGCLLRRTQVKKSVRAILEKLVSHLVAYRVVMERIFSEPLSGPDECREYFFELLISASTLYLDYLLVLRELSKVHARRRTASDFIKPDIQREASLRRRFTERIQSLPSWKGFQPEMAFSEYTGLRNLTDYLHSFTVHLPEIYEETFSAEQYAKRMLEGSGESGSRLTVSLEHLARNHISFVIQALQWAAAEVSWPAR